MYINTLYGIALNEFRSLRRNQNNIIYLFVYLTFFFILTGFFPTRWQQRAIPSALPYVVFRFMNICQAIIAIVLASQFWADEHNNTTAAIHARSFNNLTYVLGKTLGVTALFVIYNCMLAAMLFFFDILMLRDVAVPFHLFILYPLIIAMPTFVLVTGASCIAMRFVKNQGIVITILSAITIFLLVSANPENGYVSDPLAFKLPLLYSDFTGFGNGWMIFLHRGMHMLIGLGFIALSAIAFNRLRQSITATALALAMSTACFIGAYQLGHNYLTDIAEGRMLRQTMNELNRRHTDDPVVQVSDCDVSLIHKNNEIDVTARIVLTNSHEMPLEEYLFSLNPALTIQSITGKDGIERAFNRDVHLLSVVPETPVESGAGDTLVIRYSGTIDENACYTDLDEAERFRPNEYFRFVLDKRYAYVTPDYVLLTAEALWYPVPGIPSTGVYSDMSTRQFTKYTLSVETSDGYTAISQGAVNMPSEGVFSFSPEYPLTQISLVIGKYETRTLDVDGVPVTVYLKPGHDFFSRYFEELDKIGLEEYLTERKTELEVGLSISYPFERFSVVEVPVSFLAYPRFRPYAPATVQPEQVFLPEKASFLVSEFKGLITAQTIQLGRKPGLEAEKGALVNFFNHFFEISYDRNTFRRRREILRQPGFSREKLRWSTYYNTNIYEFNIFPQYYWFNNVLFTDSTDQIDLLIGSYLRSNIYHGIPVTERAPYDITVSILRNTSFIEFLENHNFYDIGHEVIETKAEEFIHMLMARAGISEKQFKDFLAGFFVLNRFKHVDTDTFIDAFRDSFGVDIRRLYTHALNVDHLPKYEITDAYLETFDNGKVRKHNIFTTIHNISDVPGVLSAYTQDIADSQEKMFILEPSQAKKVSFISELPFEWKKICFTTYLSQNYYREYVDVETITGKTRQMPFEGIQIVDSPLTLREQGHIEVDNLDEGFSVRPSPQKPKIKSIVKAYFHNDQNKPLYSSYRMKNPPDSWTLTRSSEFFGIEGGFHYIRTGDGSHSVQWETDIIKPGTYQVSLFMPPKYVLAPPYPRKNKLYVEDLHFSVYHAEGVTEKEIDVARLSANLGGSGYWVSLGTYEFTEGPARVVLSDKSKGKFVFADAVKWDIQE